MKGHEINNFGGDFTGRDRQVPFVFAIFIIDHHHHFSLAEVFNSIND